jgi:hypothetical protein
MRSDINVVCDLRERNHGDRIAAGVMGESAERRRFIFC